MMTRLRYIAATLSVLLLGGSLAAAQTPKRDAELVKDFEARVSQYMGLRKKQAGKSPKPTESADKLAETQEQMAQRLRQVRFAARQGDIFTPEIADYFRRQIAMTLEGAQGEAIRASLRHAEPHHTFEPRVNESYPEGIPLQSTPPTLLLNLPELPPELHYRIVGHALVLHDVAPNIIVDFIPNVLPQ